MEKQCPYPRRAPTAGRSLRPGSGPDPRNRPQTALRKLIPSLAAAMPSLSFALGTCLALTAPSAQAADPGLPYGINTHMPSNAVLDKVAEAGIPWIRVDFNWFQIEPGRDSYDWSTTDNMVNHARALGLNIFATLAYTPGWANENAGIGVPPYDRQDWYNFVYTVVERYRGSIQYWGMWNEPNLGDFFAGTKDEYISDVLRLGAQAARDANPGCYVAGPELAHLDSGHWTQWLHDILAQAGDVIDIVTQHDYDDTGKRVIKSMGGKHPIWSPTPRSIMEATGTDDKPLWLTETGWHTDEVSQAEQADYYEQVLTGVDGEDWLDKVFFYEVADDPNIPQKWGILTSDLIPKESFYRYQGYISAHSRSAGKATSSSTLKALQRPVPAPATRSRRSADSCPPGSSPPDHKGAVRRH